MSQLLGVALFLLINSLLVAIALLHRAKRSRWMLPRRLIRHIPLSILAVVAAIALQQLDLSSNIWTLNLNRVNLAIAQNLRPNIKLGTTNVAIGGGGYVTGIFLHPREKNLIYIKTDVGGFYRWNPRQENWIPLTDHLPMDKSHYYGGESLVLDPNNPDIVYIAAGDHLWNDPGTIFKSSDRGATWKKLDLDLLMGGNDNKRWAGERLALDPHKSQVLFFGSRRDGLWKSSDAGETWAKVTSFPGKLEKDIGVLSIAFDPKQQGVVYANAYGDGIYRSTDLGKTWNKLEASPSTANRMAIASDRTLYVTSSKDPRVSKFANNKWQDITPKGDDAPFNALSVDPRSPNHAIASIGERPYSIIYETFDGGKTWAVKDRSLKSTVPWWNGIMLKHPWISAIEFDPQVPGRTWLTDWYGIWRTDDFQASPVVWKNYVEGHEETVVFSLVSPPKGPILLSGVADVDGFVHNNGLDRYPTQEFGGNGPSFQSTYSIAYSQSDPLRLVRVGGNQWNKTYSGATSQDGGKTWQKFASFPEKTMPMRVAVSATNPNLFVVSVSNGQPIRTTDGGKTWKSVSGLPDGPGGPWNWTQSLTADAVDGNTFYYYYNDTVFRSTDGGATFAPATSINGKNQWHTLKAVPGVKGELWLAIDDRGLHHSIDGGKTFKRIENVERAYLLALGQPKPGSNIPALYVYGNVAGQGEGIFQSLNRGQTWRRLNDLNRPIGKDPKVMEASKQKFGLVFVGTGGRGIYYGSS